jgi:hypothetical protein
MSRTVLLLCCVVCLAGAAWGQNSNVPPPLPGILTNLGSLYDDFRGPIIDPQKWEGVGGWSRNTLEFVRETRLDRLRLGARTYGNRWDGGSEFDIAELDFKNPGSIFSMGSRVVVTKVQFAPCAVPGADVPYPRVQVIGNFFNAIGDPNSDAGNVDAMMELRANDPSNPKAPLVVRFLALVNGPPEIFQTIGLADLGTVNIGEEVFLFVRWDRANRRFIGGMKKDGVPAVTASLPYYQDDSLAPTWPYKGISVRNSAPNCSASQAFVAMEAWFDRVVVNVPWQP